MRGNTAIEQALAEIGQWEEVPAVLQEFALEQLNALLTKQDCFVLIDPYLAEPALVQAQVGSEGTNTDLHTLNVLRSEAWGFDCYTVAPEPLRLQVAQTPYLVHLEAAEPERYAQAVYMTLDIALQERWQAIVQGQGPQHVGGWITLHGQADGKALAASIAALMQVGRLDMGSTYLRLADARLLELLHHVSTVPLLPEPPPALDWAKQLTGICQWVYADHAFGVKAISGGEGALQEISLTLLGKHWHVLEHAEALNRTMMQWQSHAKPSGKTYARAWRAVQSAMQAGHPDPISQAQYASEQLLQENI